MGAMALGQDYFGAPASAEDLSSALAHADSTSKSSSGKIDRKALVSRHNVVRTALNTTSPLQVGNGNFAFSADITGLQTFVPFNTMSNWGWHEFPLPPGQKPEDFHGTVYETHGRPVRYEIPNTDQVDLGNWLYNNPHRINLARVGLLLTNADGTAASITDISNTTQTLDLWTGILASSFTFQGQHVTVETCASPEPDGIAVRLASPLLASGKVALFVDFPYDDQNKFAANVGDWSSENNHTTTITGQSNSRMDIEHVLDTTTYHSSIVWDGKGAAAGPSLSTSGPELTILNAKYGADQTWSDVTAIVSKSVTNNSVDLVVTNDNLGGDPYLKHTKTLVVSYKLGNTTSAKEIGEQGVLQLGNVFHAHRYVLSGHGNKLDVFVAFAPDRLPARLLSAAQTFDASERAWEHYWQTGGAVDLSGSQDDRWQELERRIVLSQYLMKVNEAGALPAQESGLVNNGWNGKFHMEMYWWHSAHWALWNRLDELDKSSGVYNKFLESSKKRAKSQGYTGARWPKMVGPEGLNSPYIIHGLLIWQQPHPIFFAELEYRARPTTKTLEKWREVVEESAEFMSSYAFWNEQRKRFELGPPVYVVSENTDPFITINPTFELSYWRFGLRLAQRWRERLGEKRHADWDNVLNNLSPLPAEDGAYVLYEGVLDMWTKFNFEHPALTGVYGWLPGDGVDLAVMHKTIEMVKTHWNMGHVWGWDMPMLAMNAARLGDQKRAVDMLLLNNGNFDFDDAGLSTGGPFPYFPSNGGLLYAIAFMAAGWDGATDANAPGFPQDGSWTVRHEGLFRAI